MDERMSRGLYIGKLEDEIAQLKHYMEHRAGTIVSLEQKLSHLEGKDDTRAATIRKQADIIHALEDTVDAKDDIITAYQEGNGKLGEDIVGLRSMWECQKRSIINYQREADALRRVRNQETAKVVALERKIVVHERTIAAKDNLIQAYSSGNTKLAAMNVELKSQLDHEKAAKDYFFGRAQFHSDSVDELTKRDKVHIETINQQQERIIGLNTSVECLKANGFSIREEYLKVSETRKLQQVNQELYTKIDKHEARIENQEKVIVTLQVDKRYLRLAMENHQAENVKLEKANEWVNKVNVGLTIERDELTYQLRDKKTLPYWGEEFRPHRLRAKTIAIKVAKQTVERQITMCRDLKSTLDYSSTIRASNGASYIDALNWVQRRLNKQLERYEK